MFELDLLGTRTIISSDGLAPLHLDAGVGGAGEMHHILACLNLLALVGELECVELWGPGDCLCGIVDQHVQMGHFLFDVLDERGDLLGAQEIALDQE